MSKIISFSISDKYLEKLRTLYPALTDNLAAKQFLTDRLDSSLGSSLDGSLYGDLDGKIKTIIETSLDGLLEGRLDAAMGKLLTSLSERMARLEERLDTNLDGGLDEMELLLRMQREASITSLIPTGEPSPLPPSPDEPVRPAIEDSEKKIIPLPDTLIVSPIETVESGSESISSINEPDTDAIETVPGKGEIPTTHKAIAARLGIKSQTKLNYWISTGKIPSEYADRCRFNESKTKILWI